MIDIDGSFGSGGGAILRVASALSAVTGKPIHISNIRKGRPQSGLSAQHLEGLKAVASICNGNLEGAEPGSEEITLSPGKIQSKELNLEIGTAGSVGLLFQILKLPACKAKKEVAINISGGATFGKWAPPLLASKNILLPVLKKMGYKADIKIEKHGFYPAGGARSSINVSPCKTLTPINLAKLGKLSHVGGLSVASFHLKKAKVAERQANEAEKLLGKYNPLIKYMYVESDSPGSGIVLWASDGNVILGSDSIGERGKEAEAIGREASQKLLTSIRFKSTVDEHLSDQLLIFMALANGQSKIITSRLTSHTETNIWLIKQFLDVEFKIRKGEAVTIECSGM